MMNKDPSKIDLLNNGKARRALSVLLVLFAVGTGFSAAAMDLDGDGVNDFIDNCSQISNAAQIDADADGFGNRCDPDLDNNGVVNFIDVSIFAARFGTNDPVADFNSNGFVNFIDFAIYPGFFGGAPGPGAAIATWTTDVSPVFVTKCAPCHTSLGVGGHNVATTYADAFLAAGHPSCTGLNVGECTIVRIQSGQMPQGAGCTGNPVLDAGNSSCLTADEQIAVQAWINAGLPL